jgi:hypothetical protein
MPKILINQGRFNPDSCTTTNNLTEAMLLKPQIRDVMTFVEHRQLSTMLVSGVDSPWKMLNTKYTNTIPKVDDSKMIGSNAYRYRVKGRLQRKSIINNQIGSSTADGRFTLSMRDSLLYEGMIARFYGGFQARVMGNPVGAAGNYVVRFQSITGAVFNYASIVGVQPGEKTCFGAATNYSEGSKIGYSYTSAHDEMVGFLGIQRKGHGITGSAMASTTEVSITSDSGKTTKLWMFTEERNQDAIFSAEDEWKKWDAISTMRDEFGNMLPGARSRIVADDTHLDVVDGDGVIEQIRGSNEMIASGIDGNATASDFEDMMDTLSTNTQSNENNTFYFITGKAGITNAQRVLRDYLIKELGGTTNVSVNNSGVPVGHWFTEFHFAGNRAIFCHNPVFDDKEKYPEIGADGKSVKGGSYVVLHMGSMENKNMEILSRGVAGINRSMVRSYLNGLTGWLAKMTTSTEDALRVDWLKENGIFIYDTTVCGLIHKPLN